MGKVLLLITLLGDLKSTSEEYKEAFTHARYGLMEVQFVKDELVEFENDAQREIYVYTGVTKDELVYFGYFYPLINGKISTKPFKNFKYVSKNGFTWRPELEYNFDGKYSMNLIMIKEF